MLLVEPLRPLLNAQLDMAPIPAEFADVRRVPDMVDTFAMKANLTDRNGAMLSVTANDEAAAIELEKLIGQWLDLAQRQMQAEMADDLARAEASDDPVEKAQARYAQRVSGKMFEMFRPVRKGNRLILDGGTGGSQAQVATIGILVALLLPAVQAAREAARRASSINNMKQLGLCMHNYHDAHRKFPARAVFDKDGKPLLSWRVKMLPYMEEGALYGQFRLDEAWDSPHNLKLAEQMPAIFRNPSSTAPPNMTTYLVPVGPGTIFEGDQGRRISDIIDGTSNTVLLVEADDDRAVLWTKPEDWKYDPQTPMAGLGRAHPGLFNVLLADGSVRSVSAGLDLQTWKALLSHAGSEVVNGFFEPRRR